MKRGTTAKRGHQDFRARTDLLLHRAGDTWIMVDPKNDRVHTLNPSAFWIWHHCDGAGSVKQLALWLSDDTSVPLERAERDVTTGLRELRARRLVEEA